jgi:hypothetical protein
MEAILVYGYAITYTEVKILFPKSQYEHLYGKSPYNPHNRILDGLNPDFNAKNSPANRTMKLAKDEIEKMLSKEMKIHLIDSNTELNDQPIENQNAIICGITMETSSIHTNTYITISDITKKQRKLLTDFIETYPMFELLEPSIHMIIKKN